MLEFATVEEIRTRLERSFYHIFLHGEDRSKYPVCLHNFPKHIKTHHWCAIGTLRNGIPVSWYDIRVSYGSPEFVIVNDRLQWACESLGVHFINFPGAT